MRISVSLTLVKRRMGRVTLLLLIVVCLCFLNGCFVNAVLKQNLDGDWKLLDAEKNFSLEATVPGGIYTDLMNNEILEDVFFDENDQKSRWASLRNWVYTKIFTVDEQLLDQENINLVFDGVDTFATIYFNDNKIGETDNMFVQYIFDVKEYIKTGSNNVTVLLYSPVNKADELYKEQTAIYEVPPACVVSQYRGECHVNHIRKMQASFAWDWGPAFPSVGLWKPVYLEAYNSTNIKYVTVNTSSSGDNWIIEVTTYLSDNGRGNIDGALIYSLKTEQDVLTTIYSVSLNASKDDEPSYSGQMSIPKISVNTWWPNGFGNQSLYTLNVTFSSKDGKEKAEKVVRIGFRTIELVQDALEADNGTTFYFKVNDIPIFMKGTNLIPVNILPELGQNETQIRFLLNSAKDVHMNMIRVWGGGVYESDTLYDVADELGIILWQDFMFACSMYPTNEKFLTTVQKEVRHQVRRLQHHACIGLWAGNNENEAALRTNWYGTDNKIQYFNDYRALYVDLIKKECLANDKSRPFVTSSPTNGIESDKENYVASDPSSTHYGDVHYYNYVLDSWDSSIYQKPRFASEYGYQSLPSLKTWLSATNDTKNLNYTSDFMDSRQHHPDGYVEILDLISHRLKSPGSDIETIIYYSQILQAMAIKIETEHYRRMKSITLDNGEGLTMGALYWQLNDVWVAPTWASIDFKNRWKMLHYFAKEFFAPVIVTGIQAIDDSLEIYTVSDLLTTIPNVSVTLQVYNWTSFTPVYEEKLTTTLESGKSELVKSLSIPEFLAKNGCGNETSSLLNCFFYLGVEDSNGPISPNNYVFPSPLKNVKTEAPELEIASVKLSEENVFEVTINSDKIALFVWLETGDILGRFSENGFLQVAPSKTVYFYPESNITVNDLKSAVTVTNLFDKKWTVSKYADDNIKVIKNEN